MSTEGPCEVPLVEQLESVPLHAREMIEISSTHHRNIPYGRYCHEAAAEIRRLKARDEASHRALAYLRQSMLDAAQRTGLGSVIEHTDAWKLVGVALKP